MRDTTIEIRVSGEEKGRWGDAARRQGITLSAYIRRAAHEAWDLEHALELQVEDEGRWQEARRGFEL